MAHTTAIAQDFLPGYLVRLAAWLQHLVAAMPAAETAPPEVLLGLHMTRGQAQSMLAEMVDDLATRMHAGEPGPKVTGVHNRSTLEPLPHQRLGAACGLSQQASELLLLLLAPAVDARFGQIYSFLQGDTARHAMTPGLAWRLLEMEPVDSQARALFAPDSPLLRHVLITVASRENGAPLPMREWPLALDERMVAFLLGDDPIDGRLAAWVRCMAPPAVDEVEGLGQPVVNTLIHLQQQWRRQGLGQAVFWGRSGSGRRTGARLVAAALRRDLLVVAGSRLATQPGFTELWKLLGREALLRDALVLLEDADRLSEEQGAIVAAAPIPGLVLSSADEHMLRSWPGALPAIHFPVPDVDLRQRWWEHHLDGRAPHDDLAAELAGRFRLTSGQIEHAVQAAQQSAWLRQGPSARPTRADLFAAAQRQSNPGLSQLAAKVTTPYTWDDLVLPPLQLSQLRAVESRIRHAPLVYGAWGFGDKLPYGKGLTALFSGPSGTGKTMAAGILARELGLELYKIDLSGVVSKYIGETEKNLSRIFDEATTANAVLFFDEADALFGKRSEVKDAHDRYANIEVSYLLQKMEEYDGMAILATNFGQNLDDAFSRRMQHVIEFPLPNGDDRARIWRGQFPDACPLSDDIDYHFLAEQFDLTGGSIKNCALTAAFLAAEEGRSIAMTHLVRAVAQELGKMGRPLQRTAFGGYFALVRSARG